MQNEFSLRILFVLRSFLVFALLFLAASYVFAQEMRSYEGEKTTCKIQVM